MQWHKFAMSLAAAFLGASCTNRHINFDQLPNGAALPPWDGTSSLSSSNPWVITTQYASEGVTSFTSNQAGGVLLWSDQSTSTPPNTACPIGVSFGPSNFSGPTTIMLGQSTSNVWVTIPSSYPAVAVTARDSNSNVLRTESSTGPNATASPTGRRVRVNASGIWRVDLDSALAGGRYCFDDFTWQERW